VRTLRTAGQPAALAAVEAMLDGLPAHAVALIGPPNVGKTTLALDLAAGLLCSAPPGERPCRACRACRLVDDGNHPDVHRLAPDGAGAQIRIAQVRALGPALALLPVEGGARIAIVEQADRLNDDAQNALLKTLEEPPAGVTIVLCADDEDRLLPTIRSRVRRIRLGSVSIRDVERLLAARELATPPEAGRIARASGGRPGLAIAYAAAPDALAARSEISRTLLDLLAEPPARRLVLGRELLVTAGKAIAALSGDGGSLGRRRGASDAEPANASTDEEPAAARDVRIPATERRRALALLVDAWLDVARDLLTIGLGDRSRVRDPSLLDDLDRADRRPSSAAVARFLGRLVETSRRVETNVSPELALDVLVLAWPHTVDAA
jgi:DNA polymerase III delta' subunit